MRAPSLRLRLFASYAAVVTAGAATFLLVTRLLAPRLFDSRVGRLGFRSGRGGPPGGGSIEAADPGLHDALTGALNIALVLALIASLAMAAIAAALVARRLLRPLDDLRRATRRLATGHYDEPVASPAEPELAALASDVNALGATLAATERRRAALIGDVAHEMRTPLTTIGGYVEGLADGVFSPEETAAAVTDELGRLERLAGDLARVSRAEEGGMELSLADDDLAAVARLVTDHLRGQFDSKGVALVVEAGSPLPVRADHDRLVQAVTNIVGNALSYTPPGGTVTVRTTRAGDGSGRLVVVDTGRGLAPADLERIFDRFFRVEHGGHARGSGIGLTIARAIARAHGGDVVAASPGPDLGATFTLSLPPRGTA